MPLRHALVARPAAARLRPALAAAPGGASSLLRLSAVTAQRPRADAIGAWIDRAARALRDGLPASPDRHARHEQPQGGPR